ncbi:hypothetical protein HYU22_02210 [Candidatus Woesearchaeota archaeon]|nr:hypothetical protein [Candidatus Woesearchaeota archaeon]
MHKKGAIGLAVDVLVIIIISLVILAGGITILYKFIGGAEQTKAQLDERTNQELERLLVDQGQQVALPLHTATIERGDSHVFGLGILNIGGVGNQFQVQVELDKAVNERQEVITAQVNREEVLNWLLFDEQTLTLAENEHYKMEILVHPDTKARTGQYIFKAKVLLPDGTQYGNTQNFVVSVV